MGWLKLNRMEGGLLSGEPRNSCSTNIKSLASTEYIEVATEVPSTRTRPRAHLSIPDAELPFVNKDEIQKVKTLTGTVWIMIDDIIYDCTDFINEHPGGTMVIRSFSGEDCSWQFWRMHSRTHLEHFGKELRVGRTEGTKNPFAEIPRYVGLRKLGNDDDW